MVSEAVRQVLGTAGPFCSLLYYQHISLGKVSRIRRSPVRKETWIIELPFA